MPHEPHLLSQNQASTSAVIRPETAKPKKPSSTFHLLAGLASGFSSAILLQPVDLLKTRVQQSGSHSLVGSIRAIAAGPSPIKQLWRGTLPSTIRTSVGSALYFTSLNILRTRIAKAEALVIGDGSTNPATAKASDSASSSTLPKLSPLANLTTGAFARASVGFIMMPITVIKVRYESNYYSYTSIASAARDIATKEGLRGFFSGFGATAIRDAPYAGLYVVFYEKGKVALSKFASGLAADMDSVDGSTSTKQAAAVPSIPASAQISRLSPSISASINFTSSVLAASTATAITNPPDAIKTRLQLQPHKYKNSLQTLRLMLKEEGIRSLFDGLGLRMARKAVSSALAWTVYEEVVRRAEAKFAQAVDD